MWLVHVVSFSFALAVPNYLPFQITPRYLTYHQIEVRTIMHEQGWFICTLDIHRDRMRSTAYTNYCRVNMLNKVLTKQVSRSYELSSCIACIICMYVQ